MVLNDAAILLVTRSSLRYTLHHTDYGVSWVHVAAKNDKLWLFPRFTTSLVTSSRPGCRSILGWMALMGDVFGSRAKYLFKVYSTA